MTPTRPVSVEPMRLDDIDAVLAIDRLSFPLPWSGATYRYELTQNTHSHFFVALAAPGGAMADPGTNWRLRLSTLLRGGSEPPTPPRLVVGYAGFWYVVDEAHISTIAVHPDWRGQGAGEQLLVGLLERALDLKAVKATLEVRVTNERAQNLYRKYGFEAVGRRRRYYRDNGEDALLMTADLHPGYRDEMRQRVQARLASKGASRPA